MTLKPWREIAVPHPDVQEGRFIQSEFAADLSRVHAGNASEEYQNPVRFFQRTFITEGMRLLLDSVVRRLSGKGGDPVIQLQTAFGGGKTHTILAVYHLARHIVPISEMQGISQILDAANITQLPDTRIAVLDGVNLLGLASKAREYGDVTVHTLWGDLAWQLGGETGYAFIKAADESGTAPGKAELTELIAACSPCVILMDELVRYVSQFEESCRLSGGTYDTQLSFIQALTEAISGVPTAVLLVSLPYSEREAGSQQGVQALHSLEHYFARVQKLWKPVATEEAFEIVRKRLFSDVTDVNAMQAVCRTYADYYRSHEHDFPRETQESGYLERLVQAYPIHPEVFDRLYEDWSTLDNFQRTRGVLKFMAKIIHRLWKDGNNDPMIMPGSLPLMDPDTRNEAIYYLPQGWDPVIERDVDGELAQTWEIEKTDARLGKVQACRRTARTIFLGSAPTTRNQQIRGLEKEHILLGTALPDQPPSLFDDSLRRLCDRLHYLNCANNRFWLDTRPNLRREMEERKRRFTDEIDVLQMIQRQIQRSFSSMPAIHVFTESGDIADDWTLRFVVLSPAFPHSKTGQSLAENKALEILKQHGNQPRYKQNRLLFIAADANNVSRLKDQARTLLAWNTIISDYKDERIVLDNLMAKHVSAEKERAEDAFRRMVRETYCWLLAPVQEVTSDNQLAEVSCEVYRLNAGEQNWSQEVNRVLDENELVISEWAPVHLAGMLKSWFWKEGIDEVNALHVWQQSCQQLYLPRLKDDTVFRRTIASGVTSTDFFGVAQRKEGDRYLGFVFGKMTSVFLDQSMLLIRPDKASAYARSIEQSQTVPCVQAGRMSAAMQVDGAVNVTGGNILPERGQHPISKHFFASIELDSVRAKLQFAEIVDEVVQQFTSKLSVNVSVSVEIEANTPDGFDEQTQRVVMENCRTLGFRNAEFDEDN
ncbi:MAG: DUF499 domain-containing protein [Oxalobacter formigenes]|nr:DUF499 domain-containing protein [Oxalobacter formigenes]